MSLGSDIQIESSRESGPVDPSDSGGTVLRRSTVDVLHVNDNDELPREGVEFIDRMDNIGLVVLNGLDDIPDAKIAEPTFGDLSSVIDYILIDSDHWECMGAVTVITSANILFCSDHRLVTSVLSYTPQILPIPSLHLPNNTSSLLSSVRFCTNSRGDKNYYEKYQAECARSLGELCERWKDQGQNGGRQQVQDMWHQFLERVNQAAEKTLGIRHQRANSNNSGVRRPGDLMLNQWRRDKKELCRLMYEIREIDREFYEILRQEETQLDRRIKHHLRKATRERLNEEIAHLRPLGQHQPREYWRRLKQIGNLQPKSSDVPNMAADSSGVVHSSIAEVKNIWYDTWSRLAQHHPNNPNFDQEFMEQIEYKVYESEQIEQESPRPIPLTLQQQQAAAALNTPITLAEVEDSVRNLLNNKSPGCDGMVSEIIKNGGPKMRECLHLLCQTAFSQSEVPLDWLRGVVVPIHKDGDTKMPLNYRPITLLSIAGKVYTGILQTRLLKWCEDNNILVIEQGGFRPKRGCAEQIFTLTELIKLRRMRKEYTYACFIDIRKAYDTVWHDGLKHKLLEYGITGEMYCAIASLYSGCKSTIRLGGSLGCTEFFRIETGVRQGCILSPLLYSIFINDLAKKIKSQECGASVDENSHIQLSVLLYADDIVLLTDEIDELQHLMETVHNYAREWRFEVNQSKCGLMRFNWNGSSTIPEDELSLGGVVVPWVTSYKYLGIELHNGVPFREYKKRALASATRAGHCVAGMGMYSGKLPVPIGIQVYQAMVRPLLEYGAEIWSIAPFPQADQLQLIMGKRILQCPTRTSTVGILGELGWMSMEARYQQLRVSFWGKIQLMEKDLPARIIYGASLEYYSRSDASDERIPAVEPKEGWDVFSNNPPSPANTFWCSRIKSDLYQLGLSKYWNNPELICAMGNDPGETWRQKVKRRVFKREQANWWRKVQGSSILRTFIQLKEHNKLKFEKYLSVPHGGWNDRIRLGRRLLTRLRCGTNELRSHTGRFEGLPEAERICPLCTDLVETEKHFLLECNYFQDQRTALFDAIGTLVNRAELSEKDVSPLPPFIVKSLPERELLLLITGGGHSRVKAKGLYQQVMRVIMIEIAEWSKLREEFMSLSASLA